MKSLSTSLALSTALVPGLAAATPVTFTTQMNSYGGDGAYLAYYVTDASGAYMGSLWMAGGKAKYYQHLSGWYAATAGNIAQVDGITGASVGAGRNLSITLDLQDALFDNGYVLHVDSSVEDMADQPNDVVIPLTSATLGQPVSGKRYVQSVTVSK
ncbi:uncharacterized protein DUF2271 [Rhodobacter sp. JA431]|uniref:DUF2271 domain-containing protein n=1 Tax=Rhodobacter sp. JA431 TaxID=570013 RepID=UPI000BD1F1E7|nr:DUF2271 domain-containing protein [Rhodobacter sp. JA431]SOC14442.1 uncharacterized protein DUF2271 [Rhodobacter sp. JA431]